MPPAAEFPTDTLHGGDCLAAMGAWPAGCMDLIFADPPYNIGYGYDQYGDAKRDDDYLAWTCAWIDQCARLLKPTGSFYVLIGDEYAAETRLHLKKLQKEGRLVFRNWIVWHYAFGQRCKLKFNRSHAHLFYCVGSANLDPKTGEGWLHMGKKMAFTFNKWDVALPSARMLVYGDKRAEPKGKAPDDVWVLRNFPATADWQARHEESDAAQFSPQCDTWMQSRLSGISLEREQWHPCQLPEALLERIIRVSSNPGDVVLDPFAGSGTTLAVAKRLGRRFVGCEMSEEYRQKIRKRLDAVTAEAQASAPATRDSLNATIRKKLAAGELKGVRPPERKRVVKGKEIKRADGGKGPKK